MPDPFRARVWREQGTGDAYVPEETAPPPTPPTSSSEVPEGSVATVLAWVGTDRSRASQALREEEAEEEPRTTLVTSLRRLLGEA